MKTETIVWTIVFLLGGVGLILNAAFRDAGRIYVQDQRHDYVHVEDELLLPWGETITAAPDRTEAVAVVAPDGSEFTLPPRRQSVGVDVPWKDTTVPARWHETWLHVEEIESSPEEAPAVEVPPLESPDRIAWTESKQVTQREYHEALKGPAAADHRFDWVRTIGTWVAAFFTLSIFSFLYKDNPLYKLAESTVVGVSAAYWMVVGFWEVIIPNLLGKLFPAMVKNWAMPGLEGHADYWYIVPLILGAMLLMRLSPKGAWISRWPLAFIIGTTAGIRMIGFIQADFVSQIRNSIKSMYNPEYVGNAVALWPTLWDSVANIILIVGVLACLVYFFFSIEHKGIVGKTAKLGIWFLMITFGAAFGYTVMGRIALLAIRIEFLVDDWLWIIDPLHRRMAGG